MPTQIKQTDTTLIFDLRDFADLGEETCYMLLVNENTYHVIFSLFQFYGNWLNRYTENKDLDVWYKPEDEQATFVGDMYDKGMEELQMTYCVQDLIDVGKQIAMSNVLMMHALTGQDFDGTSETPLEDYLAGYWDFSHNGLANRLGPTEPSTSENTIQATLERLKVSIDQLKAVVDAAGPEDLEDDLANVWEQLEGVVTILGGVPEAPPEPL